MKKIPVTILTGFLGAGKTTLLNRILSTNHGLKLAVIVNEIGQVGIDNQLVVQTNEDIIEMTNGCLCCTFREDLVVTLRNLYDLRKSGKHFFDGIILETTGLANPGPIIGSFFLDTEVNQHYSINGVVTVIDAFHLMQHLEQSIEIQEQIAFADIIVLNKENLIDTTKKKEIMEQLHRYNIGAKVIPTNYCDVDIHSLLSIGTFTIKEKLEIYKQKEQQHIHNEQIVSFSLIEKKPIDMERLNEWMTVLVHQLGENLYRYKGIVHIQGKNKRLVFQGVHSLFAASADREWRDDEERITQLVFIGKNLNREWFEDCFRELIAEQN